MNLRIRLSPHAKNNSWISPEEESGVYGDKKCPPFVFCEHAQDGFIPGGNWPGWDSVGAKRSFPSVSHVFEYRLENILLEGSKNMISALEVTR